MYVDMDTPIHSPVSPMYPPLLNTPMYPMHPMSYVPHVTENYNTSPLNLFLSTLPYPYTCQTLERAYPLWTPPR